jgi:predicted ATPase
VDRLVAAGQGCVMSAFGEYGIGKSRLTYELLRYIMTQNVWCAQFWFMPRGKNFLCFDYTGRKYLQDDKIVSHVTAMCSQKPGVLIMDDLDCADEKSLKLGGEDPDRISRKVEATRKTLGL